MKPPSHQRHKDLFGASEPWNPADWTASDDRVRGGASQSYLDCTASDAIARFHGTLDIDTLGGAGFASQHTTGEDRLWDVSAYDGVAVAIIGEDDKRYTLILKDELVARRPDGREASGVSYEYDFHVQPGRAAVVRVPWGRLTATYRGRPKEDAAPLDLKSVRRFSIMMRSYFAQQKGPFSLGIASISIYRDGDDDADDEAAVTAAAAAVESGTKKFPFPYSDGFVEAEKRGIKAQSQAQGDEWCMNLAGVWKMASECVRGR